MKNQSKAQLIQRAEICRATFQEGLTYPAWSPDRAMLWSQSLIQFVEWFLRPELPIPPFQREWYYLVTRNQFLCILAPRDHAKTTSLSIYYPLWRVMMDSNSTIMLVTAAAGVAQLALRAIKGHLEQNPFLLAGFGDLKPADPQKWTESEIIVERSDYALKDPTITTLGKGGSIRTRRVRNGFVVADDIVQADEASSEVARRNTREWASGDLLPVLEPEEQAIFIGTPQHEHDYYNELKTNKAFFFKQYDAIVDEESKQVLWPEKWRFEALEKRREAIGTIQFNRQYRCVLLADRDSLFPMFWFTGENGKRGCYDYAAHLLESHKTTELTKVTAVDLAIGESELADFFVVQTFGLDADGDYHLLDFVRKRCRFPEQVSTIVDVFDRFQPKWVVVENNSYHSRYAVSFRTHASCG